MNAPPLMGPMSGQSIIGEVTEALHKFLRDGYSIGEQPPRFETEDISYTPKDREEVLYLYLYRVAQNPNLQNRRRYRQAPVFVQSTPEDGGEVYYHRPPLLLDLFYLVMVHSKFRTEAERLLGWTLLRLNEATHLVYRPRRFNLPDGRVVDSLGRPYDPECSTEHDGLWMEKVSLAMVDDLTVGDAINFFSLHESPYRTFITYRARVALDGALVAGTGPTKISVPPIEPMSDRTPRRSESASGRMRSGRNGDR